MEIILRKYRQEDLPAITEIWNQVVEEGDSFPGDKPLSPQEAEKFFAAQSATVCACKQNGEVVGVYILHPNNIGRCSHISNASYGVKQGLRGCGIGRKLVSHSLKMAAECGFKGLQFNAVVATNQAAIALYEKLGFTRIGTIPGGYRFKSGGYQDILIFYHPV